jgi:16S rRNA (guanine(966)-N(2))-methyltransferase RsmD
MRIISGSHKGRRIIAPKNLPVRPTTDMAKEAVFNILAHRIYFEDCRILDLFAGTGNMSFEFASWGCQDITSVDAHAGCVKFIASKAAEWGFNLKVIRMDVFKFLQVPAQKYDLIFVDPPYDLSQEKFSLIPETIFRNDMLQPGGLLIVEHSPKTDLSDLIYFSSQRKYGSSLFSFFEVLEE